MAGNSFGEIFRITTFGESHGNAIGVVIDGCPAGLTVDIDFIQQELNRRKPGQSTITTQRNETDIVEIVSGIFQNRTIGSPITMLIKNKDHRPEDYSHIKDTYRPSHADFTYQSKYGLRDYRGGGRSSARETAARVMAGALAKILLSKSGMDIKAFVSSVGTVQLNKPYTMLDLSKVESNIVRCPDSETAQQMIEFIEQTKANGDTTGGIITCVIRNVPVGLGEPVFDKLHADLGKAMLSINAVHGFEYGSGFAGTRMTGSVHNDTFIPNETGGISTATNYSGGIQGGISNGMDIYFRLAFKPVATLMQTQQTVDASGKAVELDGKGRHDACVVPRAVPIVEAMAAIVLADHWLRSKVSKF